MRKQIAIAVVLSVSLTAAARAADYYYDHFFAFKDSVIALPSPTVCVNSGVKSIAMALDEENVLQLAYLCNSGTVVIRTDMRPNGGSTGTINKDIHLGLDAINGGWAYECGHVIESVSVTLNGRTQDFGISFYRGARSDVAAAFGNTCAEMGASGIGFYPDTSGLAPGTYPMTMQVVDDAGHRSPVSNTQMVVVR